LRIGRQGDADALLVHDPEGEIAFVEGGHGTERVAIMENRFLLVGPRDDPAGVAKAAGAVEALDRIAERGAMFLSRGDDSGTHRKELRLWRAEPSGRWYRETGAGMGATLNIAAELGAYTLVDLGSWAAFGNKGELVVLLEDAAALRNLYSLIPVAPKGRAAVRLEAVEKLRDWLTSDSGRQAIAGHKIDGKAVFCPSDMVGGVHKIEVCGPD